MSQQADRHFSSRRSFLGLSAAMAAGLGAAKPKKVPIALELYSVREECKRDIKATLRAVAKMGYEGVEFYAVYFDYTLEQLKELRKLMDDLSLRCYSMHNSGKYLEPDQLSRAIECNQILGNRQIVQASAPKATTARPWQELAEKLNGVAAKLKPLGLRVGYHNHEVEFRPIEGGRLPWEILGDNTGKDVILQLDIGAMLSAGADPVAWMKRYSGRTATMHVKDWSADPAKGFRVLLGEGSAKWKEIFEVAEQVGGIECYIIEQEGSALTPMETVERCLKIMRKMRG